MRFRERLDSTSLRLRGGPRQAVNMANDSIRNVRFGGAPSSGVMRSVPPASLLAASLRGPQNRRQATIPDAGPSTWIDDVPVLFR